MYTCVALDYLLQPLGGHGGTHGSTRMRSCAGYLVRRYAGSEHETVREKICNLQWTGRNSQVSTWALLHAHTLKKARVRILHFLGASREPGSWACRSSSAPYLVLPRAETRGEEAPQIGCFG